MKCDFFIFLVLYVPLLPYWFTNFGAKLQCQFIVIISLVTIKLLWQHFLK